MEREPTTEFERGLEILEAEDAALGDRVQRVVDLLDSSDVDVRDVLVAYGMGLRERVDDGTADRRIESLVRLAWSYDIDLRKDDFRQGEPADDGLGADDPAADGADAGRALVVESVTVSRRRATVDEPVELRATVANRTGGHAERSVPLVIDGETVDVATLALAAGDAHDLVYSVSFDTPGAHDIEVGEADTLSLYVSAPTADPEETSEQPSANAASDDGEVVNSTSTPVGAVTTVGDLGAGGRPSTDEPATSAPSQTPATGDDRPPSDDGSTGLLTATEVAGVYAVDDDDRYAAIARVRPPEPDAVGSPAVTGKSLSEYVESYLSGLSFPVELVAVSDGNEGSTTKAASRKQGDGADPAQPPASAPPDRAYYVLTYLEAENVPDQSLTDRLFSGGVLARLLGRSPPDSRGDATAAPGRLADRLDAVRAVLDPLEVAVEPADATEAERVVAPRRAADRTDAPADSATDAGESPTTAAEDPATGARGRPGP